MRVPMGVDVRYARSSGCECVPGFGGVQLALDVGRPYPTCKSLGCDLEE